MATSATAGSACGRGSSVGRSNADLLFAAQRGEQQAWDELVERYSRLVWAVVRGFELSSADAADLSQKVWMRLIENLDSIREPDRLGSWLATTTRREAIRLRRDRQRQVPVSAEDLHDVMPEADQAQGPEELAVTRDDHVQLIAAMNKLPHRAKTILRMKAADATTAEIAAHLGIAESTVRGHVARSLELLRGYLTESTADGAQPLR